MRYYKNSYKTMDRECAPDYDWDQDLIVCYEYESEESMKLGLNTLSFSFTFQHENDTVFFSYFQPYTLSDLEDLLFVLKTKYPEEHLNNVLKVQKLCETMAGNPCYILTITTDVKRNDISLSHQAQASVAYSSNTQQQTSSTNLQKTASSQNVLAEATAENPAEATEVPASSTEKGKKRLKQVIFLTSRVHPGEANAQFMVHGAIEFLL